MSKLRFVVLTLVVSMVSSRLLAAEAAKLTFVRPMPYQVIQREGFDARHASVHEPTGPELGYADVVTRATLPNAVQGNWQFRLELLDHGFGRAFDWLPIEASETGKELKWLVEIPAGGWYRLHLRCVDGDETTAEGSVGPIGVGEVFVVAGQSYAGGHNDEVLKVTDAAQAVSTYDWQTKAWRIAHDPPPHNGDGGSIWPALGDMLSPTLRVPVAFVNVSVGATSTTKWLPDGPLHKRLIQVGREIGRFRAVLWQQGESDVIENTPTETYIKNMREIRDAAAEGWHFDVPWLLAKSTLHPTVYNDPRGEERIRMGTDQLWKQAGFAPGPDTDLLGGDNRGDAKSKRHFSGLGQRRAALLWFVAIWNQVEKDGKVDEK